MKLAFFFLMFAGFSTERIHEDNVPVLEQNATDLKKSGRDSSEKGKSAEKYVAPESLKRRSKIFGTLVLNLVESYSMPEDSLKMAMTDTKWSSMKITGNVNLFPSGSSIKAIRDLGANTILWKDQNSLIPDELKRQIEASLKKQEAEMASSLFDCLFDWLPIAKDTEETQSANSKEIDAFVKEIMFLMATNVDIEKRERRKGSNCLMLAAIFSAEKAIVELIRRGAKPNVINKEGNTALHWASRYDENELLCKILLQNGANVNLANKSGKTPLMVGAIKGRIKVVRLLLQAGAMTEMRDSDGKTAEELGTRMCANVIRYYKHW